MQHSSFHRPHIDEGPCTCDECGSGPGEAATLQVYIYIKFTVRKSRGFDSTPFHSSERPYKCAVLKLARQPNTTIFTAAKRPLQCGECEFKGDEGDTLHFAICQSLRCPFSSKVQMITNLYLQICLHFYGPSRRVALVIDTSDKRSI